MKFQNQLFLSVLLLFMCWPGYAHSISAFPGAQGFGANSVGGRGGTVIKVTNLNNSGAGSFRSAVMTPGKRTIVFTVSGIINLSSDIIITDPYLTIAGQTSPGGILITGRTVIINTHDVIVQHIRFRLGSHGASSPSEYEVFDALRIVGNSEPAWYTNAAYNIIIDHCSISWGVDEDFEISVGATDVTVQWSIISEGLSNAGHPKGEHSKGFIVWGERAKAPMNISFHHNYLVHNKDRNPMISGATAYGPPYTDVLLDAVNNVIYNYYLNLPMMTYTTGKANWVHNYVKRGPGSGTSSFEAVHFPEGSPMQQLIYSEGNIGSRRSTQSDPEWSVGFEWRNEYLNEGYRTMTPWSAPQVKKTTMSSSVANCILSAVGATAPAKDSVDVRILADFANGTGSYKNNVSYPADFPTFSTPAYPADSDNDGMADSWETVNGMDTTKNDSTLDKDKDGYTNIEEYLHYLSANSYTFNALCMPDTMPPAAPQTSVK